MLANTFILKNFIYFHDSQDRAYDRSYKNTPTGDHTDAELLFSLNFSQIVEMCFVTAKYLVDISFEDDKS